MYIRLKENSRADVVDSVAAANDTTTRNTQLGGYRRGQKKQIRRQRVRTEHQDRCTQESLSKKESFPTFM